MKGTPFRLVGTAPAEGFEPVIGSLANLALEVTFDESPSADLYHPGSLAPLNSPTAGFEELVHRPAFPRLQSLRDAKHKRRHGVTGAVALRLLVPPRRSPRAPRDDEPVFRSIGRLDPI